jgi:hypothetical protein
MHARHAALVCPNRTRPLHHYLSLSLSLSLTRAQHSYAAVYRLLHNVLVIVVSRAHANVFANLNLVTVISRMLVAELKSVEITPERVLKKYAQVRWLRARACVCVCVCVCVRVCARVCACVRA